VNQRNFLFVMIAAAALPLPAAAQDMCVALRRIAAAAGEPVPFASLEPGGRSLVPGYDYCRVETGTPARAGGVFCHQQFAPKSLIADAVGAQVQDCLRVTPVQQERPANGLVYRTADLLITVESRCDERCHVGRVASLSIARRREGETSPSQ
jgi:hypothetical protein